MQATVLSQPALMFPVEISGFHVICAECEGFVARSGALRNCRHQRDSESSMSKNSRERGGEFADENDVRASGSSSEVNDRRQYRRIPFVRPKDTVGGQKGRFLKLNRRETALADGVSDLVLRTGDAARGRRLRIKDENGVRSSMNEGLITEIAISVGNDCVNQPRYDPEALMQEWREWLERWERLMKSR